MEILKSHGVSEAHYLAWATARQRRIYRISRWVVAAVIVGILAVILREMWPEIEPRMNAKILGAFIFALVLIGGGTVWAMRSSRNTYAENMMRYGLVRYTSPKYLNRLSPETWQAIKAFTPQPAPHTKAAAPSVDLSSPIILRLQKIQKGVGWFTVLMVVAYFFIPENRFENIGPAWVAASLIPFGFWIGAKGALFFYAKQLYDMETGLLFRGRYAQFMGIVAILSALALIIVGVWGLTHNLPTAPLPSLPRGTF